MALGWKRNKKHRSIKAKKLGASSKRKRDNKGSTASVPLEGELPAFSRGFKVAPESIELPKELR